MHDIMKIVVFEYHALSYREFLELEPFELNDIIPFLQFTDRNLWESSRYMSYIIAKVNGNKRLKLKDMLNLPWDNDIKDKSGGPMSGADIERLRLKAKKIMNK